MPSRKGRWHVPPCPLCVRWTCECGQVKTNLINAFSYPVCVVCGSHNGTSVHAHHYDDALRIEHTDRYRMMSRVLLHDPLHVRRLMGLKDALKLIINDFEVQWRTGLHTATGSPENNLAVNRGNRLLLELETLVRDWVKNHPEES